MSESEYQNWWPLHRRAALGEKLTDAEWADYEAGLSRMWANDPPLRSGASLQLTEERISELEAEYARLTTQKDELLARIAALQQSKKVNATPSGANGAT